MKKRAFRRKRPFRHRRIRRKKTPLYRRPRSKLYSFKRSCELSNLEVLAGSSAAFKNYIFSLDQLPNSSEYTNLFDRYRICGVKVTFYPPYNISYVAATSTASPVMEFYSVVDYDSNASITSLDQMNQYDTLKRSYFNRPHVRYLKPRPNMKGLFNQQGGTTTGTAVLSNKVWIDQADHTVDYYGLYVAVASSQSSIVDHHYIRCTATFYFQCRNVV